MGCTYNFEKVSRKNFLNGKSRFVLDEEGCCIAEYNLDYQTIALDLTAMTFFIE